MANIKVIINGPLMDGHNVTFKAPCDCSSVEYLNVCHIKDGTQQGTLFTMKDAHGNDLTGLGNLFVEGAYVKAVLDTTNNFAYLQNAATNGYIEEKIAGFRTIRVGTSAPNNSVGVNGDIYIQVVS